MGKLIDFGIGFAITAAAIWLCWFLLRSEIDNGPQSYSRCREGFIERKNSFDDYWTLSNQACVGDR